MTECTSIQFRELSSLLVLKPISNSVEGLIASALKQDHALIGGKKTKLSTSFGLINQLSNVLELL